MAKKKPSWLEVSGPVRAEAAQGVYSAAYSLAELADKEIIDPEKFKGFRQRSRLETVYWRAGWSRGDIIAAGGRGAFASKADVVVVFLHGWDGSEAIWEDLPGKLCALEPNILVLVPDVNGFGRSPFRKPETLAFRDCDPKANMRAVEGWLRLLGLLGGRRHMPVVFVGHSMSGASLFYLNERAWSKQRVGRCALAPALLTNDVLRQGFYRSLGIGIWAGRQLQLDLLTETISRGIIAQLIPGASQAVRAEHERIFKRTSKVTLANTFYAMGQAKSPVHGPDWQRFRVVLGHSDRLVGVGPMLTSLADLGFSSRQIRVVLGDHYFFSISRESQRLHRENKDIVLEEIRALVAECR